MYSVWVRERLPLTRFLQTQRGAMPGIRCLTMGVLQARAARSRSLPRLVRTMSSSYCSLVEDLR